MSISKQYDLIGMSIKKDYTSYLHMCISATELYCNLSLFIIIHGWHICILRTSKLMYCRGSEYLTLAMQC